MRLAEYRQKRRFRQTPEPKGKKAIARGRRYVIQKHAASHLHYDFRLEVDGVMKSWAVPKGPSLDPREKRLAMQVEDHPIEYADFEGVIPKGEYGGGTVMIWDRGHWQPEGDPRDELDRGKMSFTLEGERLQGRWTLVRSETTSAKGNHNAWLLIKAKDAEAQASSAGELSQWITSVASGRNMEEIASNRSRVWSSGRASKRRSATRTVANPAAVSVKADVSELSGARKAALPARFTPELATLAERPPNGDDWWHETKLDGYRMACRIDGGKIELLSRNMLSWTMRLPHIVEAARRLPVRRALFDGEVVALQSNGATDFQALQNAFREGRVASLVYFVFDLLHVDGYDVTATPLYQRNALVERLMVAGASGPIRYAEHVVGRGPQVFQEACKLGMEGIVSKRRDSPYRPGRGYDWFKSKCVERDEFVIGGYTEPQGSRKGFGSLLLGYYEEKKRPIYAGRVGTGFSGQIIAELMVRLQEAEQRESPFENLSTREGRTMKAHWVKPTLVAQIEFRGRTRDGMLRQASYQGLREDKAFKEVVREEPVSPKNVEAATETNGSRVARSRDRATTGSLGGRATTRRLGDRAKTGRLGGGATTGTPVVAWSPDHATRSALRAGRTSQTAVHLSSTGVKMTHPDKVLYPDQGLTKADLAQYYLEVAEWMLPHVANRPLVLVRCPEGQRKACFYQKHAGRGTPKQLTLVPIEESGKTVQYVSVRDAPGLVALVQLGALEVHAWGSRTDDVDRPDRLVFDLDPDPTVPWPRVVESARQMRAFLRDLGLESFVKTTGGKGLHVVVPIVRRHAWDEAAVVCRRIAEMAVAADPNRYVFSMSKAARKHRIYIDYLRNKRGAISVASYSTRSKPTAPVSVPLAWDELRDEIRSDQFTVRNLGARLAKLRNDPWEAIGSMRQGITAGLKRKLGL